MEAPFAGDCEFGEDPAESDAPFDASFARADGVEGSEGLCPPEEPRESEPFGEAWPPEENAFCEFCKTGFAASALAADFCVRFAPKANGPVGFVAPTTVVPAGRAMGGSEAELSDEELPAAPAELCAPVAGAPALSGAAMEDVLEDKVNVRFHLVSTGS